MANKPNGVIYIGVTDNIEERVKSIAETNTIFEICLFPICIDYTLHWDHVFITFSIQFSDISCKNNNDTVSRMHFVSTKQ